MGGAGARGAAGRATTKGGTTCGWPRHCEGGQLGCEDAAGPGQLGALRRKEYLQMSLFPGHSSPVGGGALCSLAKLREHAFASTNVMRMEESCVTPWCALRWNTATSSTPSAPRSAKTRAAYERVTPMPTLPTHTRVGSISRSPIVQTRGGRGPPPPKKALMFEQHERIQYLPSCNSNVI